MWFPSTLLPNSPLYDPQLFFTGTASWQIWKKPLGKTIAQMLCIGGARGGNGGTSSSTVGGGGGGSAAISRLIIPLELLPDILYIEVGAGSKGGAASGNALAGARSFISLQPNSTAANCYLASGNAAAATSTGITGGAAETIATTANCILASNGLFLAIAGEAGAGGGNGGGGTGQTALATKPLNGGCGAGGGANTGGSVTGAGLLPTITGGSGGASPTAGQSGITLWANGIAGFMSTSGAGGGGTATAATTGGAGGNGGLGSGGAGGGGSSNSTAGAGGRGGDGLVAIWCR